MKSDVLTGARVLVVDDDEALVAFFVEVLEDRGLVAVGETDPQRALARVSESEFDVLVSDVEMPGLRGPDLMAAVHAVKPSQLVILMTAFGSIELAVRTMRAGAVDFLAKPFPADALLLAIERALNERSMRRELVRLRSLVGDLETGELVAKSPAMKRVIEIATRAASSVTPILLTGESGVGKSSVAAFIHQKSPRKGRSFIAANCASLPLTLAESELFGVRRGAYTGATEDREGLFSRAHRGTLFLDEVGELPIEVQPKLLDVRDGGRIRPLGGTEATVDVRVVAATNVMLERAVEERRFRADLFYRLNVLRIEIPPLRQRGQDVPELVDVLLKRAASRTQRRLHGITADAMRKIVAHPFPGNVRELANLLERAAVLAEHDVITADDLVFDTAAPLVTDFLDEAVRQRLPLVDVENTYIDRVLAAVGGSKSEAAKVLDIDRRTLYRRLER